MLPEENMGLTKHTVYTGRGITAAILDTGIYGKHQDFRNRIRVFCDFISYRTQPYDDNGHGTHVAGILCGDGTASHGQYRGIAPGCNIASLKVLDRLGNGNRENVLRAFHWLMKNGKRYGIRIINISVGTTYQTSNDHEDLIRGVEQLWDEGFIVVAAAGNQGPKISSITAPGSSKKIITVGSSDLLKGKSAVSSRGPTIDCVCKPDLVAPGNRIISCSANPNVPYSVKSGTSMSTPVISGAIAVMLEKNPKLTNVEIKKMLKDSTDDLGLPRNIQGWGKFNCKKFLSL